uniref:Cation channel sperm associated auxiliary subunit gamma n=1 Tax=Rhinopithecus bieti TaxID=61621 RepID=A0A2K6KBC0_RHIBE
MCGPAMFPAGPRWPGVRVLQMLWALLAVLLASQRLWAIKDFGECTWQVVLNEFKRVGENGASDRFFEQELVDTVGNLFHMLVDSPIDPREKYLGFPYYLKINYSCEEKHSEDLVRMGHLTGLKPMVLVTFQSPVNFYRWKIEQLQIQMEAAPFRSKEPCMAEEVCGMSWYTPMPIKNGSVVMRVDVSSNGLGTFIPNKRFQVNINGFLKRKQDNNIQFTVGDELFDLMPWYFVGISSRPLWHTVDQSPVLILGGIPNEKYVLMTDTSFKDFSLVELSIDSCWVGSFYCPQSGFTATIYDTIATESTLFIRQNQLVYYFTGTYTTLYERNRGSGSWVRVLASECIKKLCPVYFHSNGSEYIMALTTGKHEGFVHFGTIRDGQVSFEMLPRQWSVCEQIGVTTCSIIWSDYIAGEYTLLLLVESEYENASKRFQVVSYNTASDDLELLYRIPEFIPEARGLEFLMILGTESYTDTVMAPKGISCNPYNHLIFIWGNFLLQSSNKENFIYLADFPKELSIKYMARSFCGAVAIVTETEEIWYLLEGSYRVYRLFPSKGWKVHISLQLMQQSSLYASNETMLTLFYEDSKLYQLVYLMNNQKGQLVKRLMPVEQLLMYQQHTSHYDLDRKGGYLMLSFTNFCPFSVMRLRSLPGPQRYTRQERYRARPPRVLERSGFHNENSLAIYQGLIYYLLWLHSVYDKGNLMVPVFIGCPPGKRLAFDITYTLEYSRLKNKHYFDCVQVDPEMPCFLFRDIFYPFFLIQDLVTGDSGSFQGSYVLLVVGGGPTLDTLKDYNKDEIYRFNSPLDKTNSLIWTTRTKRTTKDSAFHVMSHESPGIEWLCLENAPCYDNVPQGIFAPEFFFKVLVSNRGVDTSTYCNYQLTFLLHIHGLPLSPKRALFILMVSVSVFVGLVTFYIAFCLLWPLVAKGCTMIRWKINDIIASESYYTYASISGISSMQSLRRSRMGSVFSSRMTEDRAEPKEAVERQLMT